MTASEWYEKTSRLIQYINANPHIIAMNPCLDGVADYLRDMQMSLAACEKERDEETLALEYCNNECKLAMDKAIEAEARVKVLEEALEQIEDHHNETEGWRDIARAALAGKEASGE